MAEQKNVEVKPFAIVKPDNKFQTPGMPGEPDLSGSRPVHAFSTKAPLAVNGSMVDLRVHQAPVDVDLTVPKAAEATPLTVDSSATANASSSENDSSETGSTPEPKEVIPPSSSSESSVVSVAAEKGTHEIELEKPEPEEEELPPPLALRPGMAFTTLPLPPIPSS